MACMLYYNVGALLCRIAAAEKLCATFNPLWLFIGRTSIRRGFIASFSICLKPLPSEQARRRRDPKAISQIKTYGSINA